MHFPDIVIRMPKVMSTNICLNSINPNNLTTIGSTVVKTCLKINAERDSITSLFVSTKTNLIPWQRTQLLQVRTMPQMCLLLNQGLAARVNPYLWKLCMLVGYRGNFLFLCISMIYRIGILCYITHDSPLFRLVVDCSSVVYICLLIWRGINKLTDRKSVV